MHARGDSLDWDARLVVETEDLLGRIGFEQIEDPLLVRDERGRQQPHRRAFFRDSLRRDTNLLGLRHRRFAVGSVQVTLSHEHRHLLDSPKAEGWAPRAAPSTQCPALGRSSVHG